LARRAGIATSVVTSYLRGADPSRRRVIELAAAAGVRPEWLLTGEEPRELGQAVPVGVFLGGDGAAYDAKARQVAVVPCVEREAPRGAPAFPTAWLQMLGHHDPAGLVLVEAADDGLMPWCPRGAAALVQGALRPTTDRWGAWAIRTQTGVVLRRLVERPSGVLVAVPHLSRELQEPGAAARSPEEVDARYPALTLAGPADPRLVGLVRWVGYALP
jgi:hypothetical protein